MKRTKATQDIPAEIPPIGTRIKFLYKDYLTITATIREIWLWENGDFRVFLIDCDAPNLTHGFLNYTPSHEWIFVAFPSEHTEIVRIELI